MSQSIVALDVETASRFPNSLCQISLIKVSIPPISLFTCLVRPPENFFDSYNIKIHGIRPEMTEDAPTLDSIWPLLFGFLEGAKLIAHNASFDKNVITKSLEYYGITVPNFDWECTYKATGKKLLEACAEYNVNLENHHDSSFDALACARLYSKLNFTSSMENTGLVESYSEYGDRKLSGAVLKQDLSNADPNSFFYDKKVVFTGVLSAIDRSSAAKIVKSMGADVDTGITKRTKFVICGEGVGPSKMRKIEKYNSEGCHIELLNEEEFLKILSDEQHI